ncbi:DNA (cytosine-5-)-methyltransferase [Celeribacter halophilus]|uniref:Cytosine-specific methyltransferase n=1 Tax=Celeribacter halophilus TaxID=576117 RepID=A0A1I3MPS6_9RHOB|nr:DNA (cytosine-5-)-methyltransferase [Celeribacter halophilus]PZX15466.1 DNA (cytosine-5)-methyltransferase 1 [Celeribacter halophilus]SFI98959.1 DNA (cytosine-5)-methyltransferase 1 [Celeribacter halophilus]
MKVIPEINRKLAEARKRLGVDHHVMATLLGLGPEGAEKVKLWEHGKGGKITPTKQKAIEGLPIKIPYKDTCKKPAFRFIDLFAGIGGIRLPFQEAGGRCVFTAEIDKHSKITYAANFGEVPEKDGDITKFASSEIPRHDVLLAGFPCQAFSQAGKKQGFFDTRGTMFFEIQRILAMHHPKAFLLENVKQLKGHDKQRTLKTIMAILRGEASVEIPEDVHLSKEARASLGTKLNYDVDFEVLRARDFGVPQIRERIYIVGIRRDKDAPSNHVRIKEMFHRVNENYRSKVPLKDILIDDPERTLDFTISDKLWTGHKERKKRNRANGKGFGYSLFDHRSEYCSTMSARYYKDGSEILIDQSDLGRNPRKLLPEEARALQGFPEEFVIDQVGKPQLYKQFGNSVAVPVIRAIASEMLKEANIRTRKT